MRKNKSRVKLFESDRTREWVTDFMIGIAMFVLVAFFASTHTSSALPAPLAKTQAVLEKSIENTSAKPDAAKPIPPFDQSAGSRPSNTNNNQMVMIFMALVFSTLLSLTIQFWRNLRREFASPRRKWGKG